MACLNSWYDLPTRYLSISILWCLLPRNMLKLLPGCLMSDDIPWVPSWVEVGSGLDADTLVPR